MVCVEQELLEAARVSAELLGDHGERAVPLVDVLHLPVAPLEDRDALEHGVAGRLLNLADGTAATVPCT